MYHGILNVYKEKGFTSHDVVAKLRGIAGQKKIGHTGTLDPDAEGVLPVCLGKATKVCEFLTEKDKTYEAVILLGVETDTQDAGGTVLRRQEVRCTEQEIAAALASFEGVCMQIPPMYSALKVNGKKLYELARQGIEIERKARPVTIHKIELLSVELALAQVKIRVSCSKGTYIRTLCEDIGRRLLCGACMKTLLRTVSGRFVLEESLTLKQITEEKDKGLFEKLLLPVDAIFETAAEAVIRADQEKYLYNGNMLLTEQFENITGTPEQNRYVRCYDSKGEFTALYQYRNEHELAVAKMFL